MHIHNPCRDELQEKLRKEAAELLPDLERAVDDVLVLLYELEINLRMLFRTEGAG